MKPDELPELYEGTLDDAALSALVADITQLGAGVVVSTKGGARELSNEGCSLSPDAACDALRTGTVRAVQLRYHHERQNWCDTVLRSGTGFKLVRMKQPG